MEKLIRPNLRKMFVPDSYFIWLDPDLKGADVWVVAWDADAKTMKEILLSGADFHAENARLALGRAPTKAEKKAYKARGHATHYGQTPPGMARRFGMLVHEAEQWQRRYFSIHPEVLAWHERIGQQITTPPFQIRNAFGYPFTFFGQPELPEALAWIPQSTVANVCSRGLVQLEEQNFPWVRIYMQVHDSGGVGIHRDHWDDRHTLLQYLNVPVPYPEPFTIPWSLKASPKSWGDCQDVAWAA